MCSYNYQTLTARSAEHEREITRAVERRELSPSLAQLAAELEVRATHVEAPRLADDAVEEKERALAS